MRKKFQHEILGLTDEEAIEVLVTIAELSIKHKNFWEVLRNNPFKDKKKDYFNFIVGFEIGMYFAKNNFCKDIDCNVCIYKDMCIVANELYFFSRLRVMIKKEGREKAKEWIRNRISAIRRSVEEEEMRYAV